MISGGRLGPWVDEDPIFSHFVVCIYLIGFEPTSCMNPVMFPTESEGLLLIALMGHDKGKYGT